jgi:hypothetical protein
MRVCAFAVKGLGFRERERERERFRNGFRIGGCRASRSDMLHINR